MTDQVQINECFARDGLQHEEQFVATDHKVAALQAFLDAGFLRVEATSYSHPAHVPAFADASELLRRVPRRANAASDHHKTPEVRYKATCPNPKAVERALSDQESGHGADELSLLASASDSHSKVNLHADRSEQWQRIETMVEMASDGFTLVGVVSVAFGCPFEGLIDPSVVRADVERFANLGAKIVTIGDTTGLADPRTSYSLFSALTADYPELTIVAHFHDTRGLGLANAFAAYEAGCRHFDSAMGGIGGHPAQIEYGAGQTGNVATEDLTNMFSALGIETGLDPEALMTASRMCEQILGRNLNSKVARSGFTSHLIRMAAS